MAPTARPQVIRTETAPSGSRPVSRAPSPGPVVGKTFRNQENLPHLPIPPLEDTMRRYLAALEGLQPPQEHITTKQVVDRFLKNEGPALNQRLVDYASTRASYIEEWWTESYLSYEDSVVLSLNPFFILEDDPTPSRGNQLVRAASLILASLGFVHDLRTGQLEPDQIKSTPLDMSQFQKLFGTARIPTSSGCRIQTDPESRHIVVLRRGQFYWFDVLDSQNRPCITEKALLSNLNSIMNDADLIPIDRVAASAIGVLSTEKRRAWAQYRNILCEDEGNGLYLDMLDKALFIVCLDDASPENVSEMSANMLCGTSVLKNGVQVGTCTNRYYDKLQIIVASNGAAGVNFEHSAVDGHTVLRFVADVYTELILRFAKSINSASSTLFKAKLSPWATGGPRKPDQLLEAREEIDTAPKKLDWDLSPELKLAIRFAESHLSDLICQNESVALEFEVYGKNDITQFGLSPDAFVQMAFQATYYSVYGRIVSTYEPAMTKAFFHGRTEAIRTVTPEVVDFVKTFCSDAPGSAKIAALRKACKKHSALSRECSQGLGQDRLLYAMYCLSQQPSDTAKNFSKDFTSSSEDEEEEDARTRRIPYLFKDPGYGRLGHSTMSTSNCGNPSLRLFGFGPVVADGYGLGYIIKEDSISIAASSKHLQTGRFLDTMRAYLLQVRELLQEQHREANAGPGFTTFVDHYAGEIDAKTGQPITHRTNGDDYLFSGYGFYGAEAEYLRISGERKDGPITAGKRKNTSLGTRIQTIDPLK